MNNHLKSRKLTNPESEMTRLKLLWRDSFAEAEQDYWRQQFASARTLLKMREELDTKYKVTLLYDIQFIRFRRWVEKEDLRESQEEEVACDRTELEAQGLSGEQLRDELVRRMKERALARGDFKLGEVAVKLDLRVERIGIHHCWLALHARKADVLKKTAEREAQPGGLTPEVLRQIEKNLNLM